MDEEKQTWAEMLRVYAAKAGISKTKAARHLGVPPEKYLGWCGETRKSATPEEVVYIAEKIGVDIDDFEHPPPNFKEALRQGRNRNIPSGAHPATAEENRRLREEVERLTDELNDERRDHADAELKIKRQADKIYQLTQQVNAPPSAELVKMIDDQFNAWVEVRTKLEPIWKMWKDSREKKAERENYLFEDDQIETESTRNDGEGVLRPAGGFGRDRSIVGTRNGMPNKG